MEFVAEASASSAAAASAAASSVEENSRRSRSRSSFKDPSSSTEQEEEEERNVRFSDKETVIRERKVTQNTVFNIMMTGKKSDFLGILV